MIFESFGKIIYENIEFAPSVAAFKNKLLSKIRPASKSVVRKHDSTGLSYLTQLGVGLSKLNFHKVKHNFKETINPICQSSDGSEVIESFCCSALLSKNHKETSR